MNIKNKTILITGGAGFFGAALCKELYIHNKVILLDANENLSRTMAATYDVIVEIGAIEDSVFIENIFNKYQPEVVFHCAAHKHVKSGEDNPVQTINTNIVGTLNLMQAANKYNTETFIFISSDKAEKPSNVYGETKYVGECLVRLCANFNNCRYITCRFCNLYGSSGSVVEIYRNNIKNHTPLNIAKNTYRYFIDITDAIQCLDYLYVHGVNGMVYICADGEKYSIEDIAKRVCDEANVQLGIDISYNYVDVNRVEKLDEDYLVSDITNIKLK